MSYRPFAVATHNGKGMRHHKDLSLAVKYAAEQAQEFGAPWTVIVGMSPVVIRVAPDDHLIIYRYGERVGGGLLTKYGAILDQSGQDSISSALETCILS